MKWYYEKNYIQLNLKPEWNGQILENVNANSIYKTK